MHDKVRLPAEWEKQEAIEITWPQSEEIWGKDFVDIINLFVSISKLMISHTRLIIICLKQDVIEGYFSEEEKKNIFFFEAESNDIWSRDHGFITTYQGNNVILNNFIFNGWGMKFPANHDNQINKHLQIRLDINKSTRFKNIPLVFEGGAIDSNGKGEALTTATCIFSKNRNEHLPKSSLVEEIKKVFGLKRLHILRKGFLIGDDTDSHIDMLARFVNTNTIVYATCEDDDEHFEALSAMEEELASLEDTSGDNFKIVGIPIGKIYSSGKRLPASYINFLIINHAVLIPSYNLAEDEIANSTFKKIFPDKKIIAIDCSLLIKQGGSLHCATVNFYKGTFEHTSA